MIYCSQCGAELIGDETNCQRCGSPTNNQVDLGYQQVVPMKSSGVVTAIKVFMIIGTVFMSLYTFLIGLAWCLPMTIHYFNCLKKGVQVGLGFKICTILFVNMIAGILMLTENRR